MPGGGAALAAAARELPGPGAGEPVLVSKISLPALPGWMVRRERLERLMSAATQGRLTVVTGPPGAGKTMAVAAWAAARRGAGPLAWVSLDGLDNDPAILWAAVLEALRRAGAAVPAGLAAPAASGPGSWVFLRRLVSWLAGLDPAVVLVLDDLHLLTEPAALEGLAFVLRHACAGLRLVAVSRTDPQLPLHRYRLAGELAEIRAGDLAFTVAEAGQLIAGHGITLPAGSLEDLTTRTEGWAAGLRLAALSMAGHPDPEQFVKNFSADDSAITAYLVDEVLDAQPAHVRALLLKASICGRVSDGLACELAGDPKAAGVIPALARAGMFIRPLGQGWYRLHPLLAEVLRLKLRHETPGQVPELHRRAARWLQRNGIVAEAAAQAAAAGDWPLAARIAVDGLATGRLTGSRASDPLVEVFRPLPAGLDTAEPAVWIVAATMAWRELRDDAAASWLHRAEDALAQSASDAGLAPRLAAAMIGLALARRSGDLDAAASAAGRAQAMLAQMPPALLTRHPGVHAQVLSGRGVVEMWAGRLESASSLLEHAAAIAGQGSEWSECTGQRALAEAARGRLGRAAELATAAIAPPPSGRAAVWSASAAAEAALAWAWLERGQLTESARWLSRARDALRGRPDKLTGAVACLVAARQHLARSQPHAAIETLRRARDGWSPPPWLEHRLTLAEVQACAAAANPQAALHAARRAQAAHTPEAAVALAHAYLAAADPEAARRALASAPAAATSGVPGYLRLEALLVQARLGYDGSDPGRGRRALAQALQIADREQLRLPIIAQRAWIGPVLRRDPALADAFQRLSGPHRASPGRAQAKPGAAGQAPPIIVEQLSSRERDVLRHAANMLDTAEIAGEMYISVNTVKSHLKSIHRKLAVSHRGQAVRRAQQMGLL